MGNLMRAITSILTQPGPAFRRLTLNRPAFAASMVFLVSIVSFWGCLWSRHHDAFVVNPGVFFTQAISGSMVAVLGILLLTALVHLAADLLGGAGRGLTLLLFLMFSTLPFWFAGPCALLFHVMLSMQGVFSILVSFLAVWSALLAIMSVKELYRFSFIRACTAFILPPAIMTASAWIILRVIAGSVSIPI